MTIYKEVTDLLVEADDLVGGDRKIMHGEFDANHEGIAKIWSVILKTPIPVSYTHLTLPTTPYV